LFKKELISWWIGKYFLKLKAMSSARSDNNSYFGENQIENAKLTITSHVNVKAAVHTLAKSYKTFKCLFRPLLC